MKCDKYVFSNAVVKCGGGGGEGAFYSPIIRSIVRSTISPIIRSQSASEPLLWTVNFTGASQSTPTPYWDRVGVGYFSSLMWKARYLWSWILSLFQEGWTLIKPQKVSMIIFHFFWQNCFSWGQSFLRRTEYSGVYKIVSFSPLPDRRKKDYFSLIFTVHTWR